VFGLGPFQGLPGSARCSLVTPGCSEAHRDFGLLISGRVVSFVGGQVQVFAMPLPVLRSCWSCAVIAATHHESAAVADREVAA
jgi:hypothetical protein